MWKSSYEEVKRQNGEKVGKAVFWEVGVSRMAQKRFRRTFRTSLEYSTPRKAFENFLHMFSHDRDFRNRLYLEHKWQPEADWLAKQEERRKVEETARMAAEQDMTFGCLFSHWREHASAEWSANYCRLVDGFWRELKGGLENVRLSEIAKTLPTELHARLRRNGNSKATANRKVALLLRVMNHAYRHDLIEKNPLGKYRLPSDPRPKNDFWSEEEVSHFLAITERRYPIGSPRRCIFSAYLTVINTGMRANELWALRPRDMRPEMKSIWLTHQWSPLENRFTRLKSKDDGQGRAVPMNDYVCRELLGLQRARNLGPGDLFFGVDASDPWFRPWCKPGARPVDQKNFSKRAWQTDLRLSGNRKIRFHDLRHSAATLMRKNGASRDEVRSILGHSDAATTARYDHAADDSATQVATRFVIQPKPKLELIGS